MGKKSKAEISKYLRLDELPTGFWRPLTVDDLRKVAPIKLTSGTIKVDRFTLSLLLGERERLHYIAKAAKWLADAAVEAGLVPEIPDYEEPGPMEKPVSVLFLALATLEQAPEKVIPPEKLEAYMAVLAEIKKDSP